MNFISTRDKNLKTTLSEAIRIGLAPDGGLFVPEYFPQINLSQFSAELNYPVFAAQVLKDFFSGDLLENSLLASSENAFNFSVPLNQINENTFLLELFHGPTLSFKDFGARFLAQCLNRISANHKSTIMVATSGDTGSAVASAFFQMPNINVIVLFPKGLISERQQHQIACWGENVLALAVKGNFDDCQRLVKAAFTDSWWLNYLNLSSANSINIGRLLPQIVYYAYSSMQFFQQHKKTLGFIVPSGNLGNATAAYWAKQMGFPIREIALATNANHVISDYLQSGRYQPRPSIATLANAMDVGDPSNFERLRYLFPDFADFKQHVTAISVNDAEIRTTIQEIYQKYKKIICPHTATAFCMREQLSSDNWCIVATADASKFDTIIEPIIQQKIPVTSQLQYLLNKAVHFQEVENTLADIQQVLPESWRGF